jgi:hypothetical protein
VIIVAFVVEPARESITRDGQLASNSGLRMRQLRGESRAFSLAGQILVSERHLEHWIEHHRVYPF